MKMIIAAAGLAAIAGAAAFVIRILIAVMEMGPEAGEERNGHDGD